MSNATPTVVMVGRINVGKSRLFNRLTETSKAIVSPVAGTTRDYNLGQVSWRDKNFLLIDTGGVNIENLKQSIQALSSNKITKRIIKTNVIEAEIIKQTKAALKKANLILMIVDGQDGLLVEDKQLALVLKKINLPVLLVVNKIDNQKYLSKVPEFYRLGLGQPITVSAINGSGSGDLLDEIVSRLKGKSTLANNQDSPAIKVAIIGKPNVGKSSLVNKIVGYERVIVSPIALTTRDAQDTEIFHQGEKIVLVDTAGLRQKAKVDAGLEKMAVKRTLAAIKKASIVLLITEANTRLTTQDLYLAGVLKEGKKGIILVGNKWDLVEEKDGRINKKVKDYYQGQIPYLGFAPLIFVSAKTGKNISQILDLISVVDQEMRKVIPQESLNEILKKIKSIHLPAAAKGDKKPNIFQIEQSDSYPPRFTLTVGRRDTLHFSYLRFIENNFRKDFGFLGAPIIIKIRRRK